MNLFLALVLLILALVGVILRKTYSALPVAELKRRAAKHNPIAGQLYRAVAYGTSLRSLLWLYIGFFGAASFIVLARQLPVWLSLLIVGPLLWVVFSLVPAGRTTALGVNLTRWVTPIIAWLLNYLHPALSKSASAVEKRYLKSQHTGLFEREDVLRLLKQQKKQSDNRLSDEELMIISQALSFSERQVANVLAPRKQIKSILATDTIGPILIDELHKTEQPFAIVRDTPKGEIVGVLAVSELGLRSRGLVKDVMYQPAYYLHESDSLTEALHAFSVTNQPVFVVVNSFEEYLGIISVETILEQLLGHIPGDDFEEYTNLSAVASRYSVKTDSDVVE